MRSNQDLVDRLAKTETILGAQNCPSVDVYIDGVLTKHILQCSVIESWADVCKHPYRWEHGRIATTRVTGEIKLIAK